MEEQTPGDAPHTTPTECKRLAHVEAERAHIETVLMQRFNYFIVLFGVVIAGAANVQGHVVRALLLATAAIVCCLIALTLGRAQDKLDSVFEQLKAYKWHPAAVADVDANKRGPSRRGLVGRTIPWACVVVLITFAACSLTAWFFDGSTRCRTHIECVPARGGSLTTEGPCVADPTPFNASGSDDHRAEPNDEPNEAAQ